MLNNKIAESGIITINLEDYYPKAEICIVNIKDFLYQGLVLQEKNFREQVAQIDPAKYLQKHVCINNTAEAIVPIWAYMLLRLQLEDVAKSVWVGNLDTFLFDYYQKEAEKIDFTTYTQARVMLKGCGKKQVPPTVYALWASKLKPEVKSLFFGEACAAVPLYKAKK
jgi:hypothetical protein